LPDVYFCCVSNRQKKVKTSTQVYRELKGAQFSEPQARTLVEILQAGGVVEPEPPESELDRIEQYLSAEPFQPFSIEMSSGSRYRIERRDQCGFGRHDSVQLSGVAGAESAILSSDYITRVKKMYRFGIAKKTSFNL
jgi:hypothetical protein